MQLNDYKPVARLQTKHTLIARPHFPVIDAHNHLGGDFGGNWDKRPVAELLDVLDEANVRAYVDLDGGWGEDILERHLDWFKAAAPERFLMFGGVDWSQWPEQGSRFGEWAAARLRAQASRGAQGLKIWKMLGLKVLDPQGQLAPVDDPRLDPIWQTAGELGLPVLIHIADPVAFFDPLDEGNERWEELKGHPDWHFPSPPGPSFRSLVDGLANVVQRHPQTTFIGAHVGCYAENLAWVGALLERCPNFYVDISARMAELGRQPYTARKFFLQHADQILFGIDAGPSLNYYRINYRFLETDDEYFAYDPTGVPTQGRWAVYGLDLPADVLEKVYYANALRALRLGGLPK
jgi:predicted TIM-barrel fold metal-dependent hydrolase